jgi:hypothetical protein
MPLVECASTPSLQVPFFFNWPIVDFLMRELQA